jgi:hypothetical protein
LVWAEIFFKRELLESEIIEKKFWELLNFR